MKKEISDSPLRQTKQKPPIGLVPRWFRNEYRIAEIDAAIERYNEAGFKIPEEWTIEKQELIAWNEERREKIKANTLTHKQD